VPLSNLKHGQRCTRALPYFFVLVTAALSLFFPSQAQTSVETPQQLYDLGSKQFAERRFDQARANFERAIQLDQFFAAAFRGLGLADLAVQDYEGAYHAWLKAVELNPQDEKSKYCLGRLFYDANFPNESAAWLRQALELNPNDYEAMTYLGLAAEALGFDDTAAQLYRKAIAVSEAQQKPYSWAFLSMGNYLKKHGEDSQALKVLEQGAAKCPEAHELAALGELLAAQGQTRRAEEVLRRAISLDANVSEVHYRLSLLLKSAGRSEEAKAEMLKFQETKVEENKAPKIMALRKPGTTSQ
jgi:tetratricopeptide (TPR) repeat protein